MPWVALIPYSNFLVDVAASLVESWALGYLGYIAWVGRPVQRVRRNEKQLARGGPLEHLLDY